MCEFGDLFEQSKEVGTFTMRKGAVQGERIKMCCFSYQDNEKYLKKVISSYYSLVYMFCQNLCTYTSNSEYELWYLHTEEAEAPKPQHCLLSPATMDSFALIGTRNKLHHQHTL
jgi:predicted aldo/keto reductase-like oxidoreductase